MNRDFTYLLCSLPVLLVGAVALYISYRIWSKEKENEKMRSPYHSENRVEIGYSKEDSGPGRAEVCPECGEKQMMVQWDGSGLCENCGKTTSDYSEEVEGDD